MNTIEKGNLFENKAFERIQEELSQGSFLFIPENCKIHKKKGYYSEDRKKDIIVDISIETFLPNKELSENDKWSILTVIECKDLKTRIPVNDIEEFYSKLQQITGANVKGVIISPNSLQKGAYNFAKSKGIGVIRLTDDNNLKWILNRIFKGQINYGKKEDNKEFVLEALLNERFANDYSDFFGSIDDLYTHSTNQFFNHLIIDFVEENQYQNNNIVFNKKKQNDTVVPFISKDDIENICNGILKRIDYSNNEVPIDAICVDLDINEKVKFGYEETLGSDTLGFEILGQITFNPTIISISEYTHKDSFQRKFTIAHELGHYYLSHEKYLNKEFYSERDYDDSLVNVLNIKEIKRLEWQANYFASCLLLPKLRLIKVFKELLLEEDLKDRGFGALFLDDQIGNQANFYIITNKLKTIFRVSRKVIEIRLKNLELLKDVRTTRSQSVNTVIRPV